MSRPWTKDSSGTIRCLCEDCIITGLWRAMLEVRLALRRVAP